MIVSAFSFIVVPKMALRSMSVLFTLPWRAERISGYDSVLSGGSNRQMNSF